MVMLLLGNGRFDFEVVGESYCQPSLRNLAGPQRAEGHDLDCLAALIFDDQNRFDPKAVGVAIVRRDRSIVPIGYLARAQARKYRTCVADVGKPDPQGMLCRAKIIGGWRDADGRTGQYGVRLDLKLPLSFGTVAAWTNWSQRLL
jgi:hypothetical protein